MSTFRRGLQELLRPGEGELGGQEMIRLGRVLLTATIVITNIIGAVAVLGIALFVLPLPTFTGSAHVRALDTVVALIYVTVAVTMGATLGTRAMLRLRVWMAEERPAGQSEKRLVLQAPALLFALQFSLWAIAAALFLAINLPYSSALAIRVFVLVLLTGTTTASCSYLLTELMLRPLAARALQDGLPADVQVPGVAVRAILAWMIGAGIPLAGIVVIGILGLSEDSATTRQALAKAAVVLGSTGLSVGLLAVTAAARATADPVASVRRALARVRGGDLKVRVPVYDGSQIGQLQYGFNEMVQGLDERERIRDMFGAYVDRDVAEHLLSEGTNTAGERVLVTLMFIDVRNFTGLVERSDPEQVLSELNDLFGIAVKSIHEHGGRVDKFIGDGLLAVFGAPRRLSDHADHALAAGREISLGVKGGPLEIGVGIDSGEVLAGNVGGAGRLEFTVIGDAVNVASRVEAATRQTGDEILITERTRALLRRPLGEERPDVDLRGKSERLRVYAIEP